MVIYDLIDLLTDPKFQRIEIYSIREEKTLYSGMLGDEIVYDEYGNHKIQSIDTLFNPTDVLIINTDWFFQYIII